MVATAPDDGLWTRRFHPSGPDGPRIVLFPHAGGSASYFFSLSRGLSPGVETLAVQYPGRQDRRAEECARDISLLADRITQSLLPCADRPPALFGHSMGAVVAFEVARRLEESDVAVARLFASGARAPSLIRDDGIHRRDDRGLLAELARLNGTGSEILRESEIVRMLLPALRADFTAIETYRAAPGAALRCPITVLVGDADPRVAVTEAQEWSSHTTGACGVHVFPGGHFYLDQHRDDVIRIVTSHLLPADVAPA